MSYIRCPHCDHQIPDDPPLAGRPDSCPACDRRFRRPLPIAKPAWFSAEELPHTPVVQELRDIEHRHIARHQAAFASASVVTLIWAGLLLFCIWFLCCGGCITMFIPETP